MFAVLLTRMLYILNSKITLKDLVGTATKTHPPIILKGKPKVRQSEGVSSATAVFCVTNGYSFDERGGDG